jgi:predicted glutamine amidotransferase
MCIAIFVPIGRKLSEEAARESFNSNPHGAGFAFVENGEIKVKKGYFDFDSFMKDFNRVNGNHNLLVHFRWATHGAQNEANCHPWNINGTHAMIHNGIIEGYGNFRNGRSDTGDFGDFILRPMLAGMDDAALTAPWFIEIMSRAIGDGNKMIILSKSDKVAIFNEHLGHWRGGIWYSNEDYIPLPPKKVKKKKAD